MVFNTGAALLDAIVLAVVSKEEEGTYGYKITQDVRVAIEVSESTLYPVLRRLQKDGCLMVYDRENVEVATGATTGLRMREERSWTIIAENGMTILRKYQSYFPRREFEDE